ncbi:hypothetical protein WUBG_17588, partial [Wuchereria bancrofti]
TAQESTTLVILKSFKTSLVQQMYGFGFYVPKRYMAISWMSTDVIPLLQDGISMQLKKSLWEVDVFVMDMRTHVIFWTFDVLIYSFAGVNIILVVIIVNIVAQDLNRKCGNEAKRVPNLCAN